MKRRKWDARTKSLIILEGLKGKPVADICLEHEIGQTQYYRWLDTALTKLPQLFAPENRREEALSKEVSRLKGIIGDLTVELKKNEPEWKP